MAFRIQIRRDASTIWAVNNPILLQGELGYETDTNYLKIGDGTTPWNDLGYWSGGLTGGGLIVKKNSTTVQTPTNVLNFSDDFNVTPSSSNTANISIANGGASSSTINVFKDGTLGITGATGFNFTGSPSSVTYTGKTVNVDLIGSSVPYFSVTVLLNGGGNFGSFSSSKGPDGEPLTGPNWNYSLGNSGNNVTITHNNGSVPVGLATHGSDGTNISVNYPVGSSNAPFALYYPINKNSFTVTGIQSGTWTGASASNTVDIIWTFGATL
jgi:hypothetical protein